MINSFQMNAAASTSSLKLQGNTKTSSNEGQSLFSILLNSLNGVSETDSKTLGSSLSTSTTLDSASLANSNKTSKKISQTSIESAGLLFPESAMPNLISFLENKGFSVDQVDGILLSSRNDQGLIQIDKLITAINSANAGTLSNESGLVIDASQLPKVQEVLFNMGLGVGEVKATIEKSVNEKGELSLDKLSDALKEFPQGTLLKSELASLLNQNDIKVSSQVTDIKSEGSNLQSLSNQVSSVSGKDGTSILQAAIDNMSKADQERLSKLVSSLSVKDGAATSQLAIGNMSETDQTLQSKLVSLLTANDSASTSTVAVTNKSDNALKMEILNLIENPSQDINKTAAQKISTLLKEKGVSENETKSFAETINTGLTTLKAVPQVTAQNSDQLSQVILQNKVKSQQVENSKAIDILDEVTSPNAKSPDNSLLNGKFELTLDQAEALTQGGQSAKEEILAGIAGTKIISNTKSTDEADSKDGGINIKGATGIDFTSQNITKASDSVQVKSHTQSVYNLPEPLPKVLDRMVVMMKNGEQSGKVMIQPPELGKIDIDLTIKNGHVQANLSTESYAVKEIIESNMNQLKQQLTDQGLIVEQFNVSVGSQNRQFRDDNGQAWNGNNGSSRSGASEIEDITAAMDGGITSNIMSSQYKIDVRV